MANVGDRLKEERTFKGWSQRDLAQESGTNVDTISGIERGQHEPRPSTLRKLATALGIQVRDLFEEPALPLAEAPPSGPPRVSRERLEEHFENVRQDEVDYLNDEVIADFWRLALPGEKPQAHFVPEDIDTDRVWRFLEHALSANNVFEPEEAERINRGARKLALAGDGG